MSLRLIEVSTPKVITPELEKAISKIEHTDCWRTTDDTALMHGFSILTISDLSQSILDILKTHLGADEKTRIVVMSPEAAIPHVAQKESETTAEEKKAQKKVFIEGVSREELYDDVIGGAELTGNYILLVILSTIVASIGVIENNVPVLIGAMVIAPLLGPNLALAFGTTLGDFKLMLHSVKTTIVGLLICFIFSFLIGALLNLFTAHANHYLATHVGYHSIILALTSGGAAALSLVGGVSSALVGVMIAVALIIPTVVLGISIGVENYFNALNALLMLGVNIVCINIAANIIFMFKGIRPSLWYEQQRAKKVSFWLAIVWISALIILSILISLFYRLWM